MKEQRDEANKVINQQTLGNGLDAENHYVAAVLERPQVASEATVSLTKSM